MYLLVLCDSSYFYFDLNFSYPPFSNGWFHFRYTHALLMGGGESSQGAASLSSLFSTQESTFLFCGQQFPGQMGFSRAVREHLGTLSMESTIVGHERTEQTYNRSPKIWYFHQMITKTCGCVPLPFLFGIFFFTFSLNKRYGLKRILVFLSCIFNLYPLETASWAGVRVGPCF